MAYPLSETDAAHLRSADRLTQLRQQAQSVSQKTILKGSPESLWPVFSYTDFLNQMVGMQETQNSYLNRDYGSTWMHAETKNAGLAVAYEELPYEWEAPYRYHVERIHSKGPLKYLRFGVELQPKGMEQTEVTCTIQFVSHLPAAIAKVLISKEISRFMQSFQTLAQSLDAGRPALRAFFEPEAAFKQQMAGWTQQWHTLGIPLTIASALADYIARAPERLAYRLRPFELAQAYQLDPLDVLKACLILGREGLLHVMWDCRCPGCKGPKESFSKLSDIKSMAYCPTCAVSYGLAFDQNLELTFQPASALRATTEKYFCAGSPGNTPHISWQQNLAANQQGQFKLQLASGLYVLRSLSSGNELVFRLLDEPQDPAAQDHVLIDFAGEFKIPASGTAETADIIVLNPHAELSIHNHNSHEVTLMLENLNWQSQAVTAARVQAVQAFHDLFPEEVLAPGEALPLQAQLFLRVDILNELAVADALEPETRQEIQAWVYQRMQQHEGAALLLDSNSLLGIFASPFEALSVAWDLQQELASLNLLYPTPVKLGLGIAQGPCEVFVQDNRLNYRGDVCERVAQASQLSAGYGIVIGESLLTGPEMQSFLQDPLVPWDYLDGSDSNSIERWVRFEFANDLMELLL